MMTAVRRMPKMHICIPRTCGWKYSKKRCASRARRWLEDFRHNIISAHPLERVFQILYNNAEYPHSCLAAVVESDGHIYRQMDGRKEWSPSCVIYCV